jgi:uncharacterized glyoxalase superfamily protein PhnB
MSSIIPVLRYDDATRAVQWLCDVFGFVEHQIYKDDQQKVIHAELRFGNNILMLGPNAPTAFGQFMRQPREVGHIETQLCFLSVDQIELFFEKCKAHKVEILMPLKKQDYGSSDFVCKDFEGHIWSIGDYQPKDLF